MLNYKLIKCEFKINIGLVVYHNAIIIILFSKKIQEIVTFDFYK